MNWRFWEWGRKHKLVPEEWVRKGVCLGAGTATVIRLPGDDGGRSHYITAITAAYGGETKGSMVVEVEGTPKARYLVYGSRAISWVKPPPLGEGAEVWVILEPRHGVVGELVVTGFTA